MDTHKRTICKLVFPSLLGILLFLVPVRYQGGTEIVVGIVGSRLKDAIRFSAAWRRPVWR